MLLKPAYKYILIVGKSSPEPELDRYTRLPETRQFGITEIDPSHVLNKCMIGWIEIQGGFRCSFVVQQTTECE